MVRLMVFVDGSNLVGDLRRMRLQVDDYEAFFRYLVEQAVAVWRPCCYGASQPVAHLIRVMWYALGDLDKWDLKDARAQATLREAFEKDREVKSKYMALAGAKFPGKPQPELANDAWSLCFAEFREWYDERCRLVDGFRRFYHSVRSGTDFIDIVECGHWKVDLLDRRVTEKGLDTRLAVDMVTLKDGYDMALLLSGDADNIPCLDYVKAGGKQVGVVEFLAGHPPEKKSAHSSSRLKVAADFVVQLYETELEAKKLAIRPPEGGA